MAGNLCFINICLSLIITPQRSMSRVAMVLYFDINMLYYSHINLHLTMPDYITFRKICVRNAGHKI